MQHKSPTVALLNSHVLLVELMRQHINGWTEKTIMPLPTSRSVGWARAVQCEMCTHSRKSRENYREMRPLVATSGFNQSELEMWRVPRFCLVSSGEGEKNWKLTWQPSFSDNVLKYHKVWWVFITVICTSGGNTAAQRFSIENHNTH